MLSGALASHRNDEFSPQVVIKGEEPVVCYPSDFFTSERTPDGEVPYYWGNAAPTPRVEAQPKISIHQGKLSRQTLLE